MFHCCSARGGRDIVAGDRCENPGRERYRKHCEGAVDDLIIAKIFDDATGMSDSCPIAAKESANFGEGETKCHVRQIHRNLAGQRNRGASPARPKCKRGNLEDR
jgi:hypothetical protein